LNIKTTASASVRTLMLPAGSPARVHEYGKYWPGWPSLAIHAPSTAPTAKIYMHPSVSDHGAPRGLMKVRFEAVGGGRSVFVVAVSVPVVTGLFARHSGFVGALFIRHVGFAQIRIHSQNDGCGDRAP
jgi:hypothetical protein